MYRTTSAWHLLIVMAILSSVTQAGDHERVFDPMAFFQHLDMELEGLGDLRRHVDAGEMKEAMAEWLAYCRRRQNIRWFWSGEDRPAISDYLTSEMPDERASLLADADEIMAHRFPNSSAGTVVYRVQLPREFSWAENPTRDPQFTFMLQRHKFWVELAVAHLLTDDEAYVREWLWQLDGWLAEVPEDAAASWKERHPMWYALDAGIRSKQWTWVLHLLLDSPLLEPELFARWSHQWWIHGHFLRHHHAGVGSNWCAMQMEGLLCIALTFPEFRESREWREYATATLIKAIRAQVRDDGVQVEQSPSYHVGCVRWFSEPMRLGELNGIPWPDDYRRRLELMCEFIQWTTGTDGRTVALSDSDRDQWGLKLLAAGALLFDRPDFAFRARPDWRHAFLYGPDKLRRLKALRPEPPDATIRLFPDAGYVFMRSGWDDRAHYLAFDCGPKGGGHGHLDLLNIEIHAFGRLFIADPGRWLYDDSALRHEMLSTPAHNTISLNGRSHGVFENNANGEYRLGPVGRSGNWTYVEGEHRAYTDLPGPPVCRRALFYNGGDIWFLVDRVRAEQPIEALVNYQLAVDRVWRDEQGILRIGEPDQPQLLMLHQPVASTTAAIEPSILSRVYGDQEPALRIRLRQEGTELLLLTAIVAHERGEPAPCRLTLLEKQPCAFQLERGTQTIRITEQRDRTWRIEED